MNALKRFFFPRSPWAGCIPMTESDRLAMWERRRGEHLAIQRQSAAIAASHFDYMAASANDYPDEPDPADYINDYRDIRGS